MKFNRNLRLVALVLTAVVCSEAPAEDPQTPKAIDEWKAEQEHYVRQTLHLYFEGVRRGDYSLHHEITDSFLQTRPDVSLEVIEKYVEDELSDVRHRVVGLLARLARGLHSASKVRKRCVEYLTQLVFDPRVGQQAGRSLLQFEEHDFTFEAQNYLRNHAVQGRPQAHVFLVIGVANMIEMDRWLKEQRGFEAVLALARMGDDEAAKEAVRRLDGIEPESRRVRKSLNGLAYTRHPICLEYVAGYLDREDGADRGSDYYFPPYQHTAMQVIAKNVPGAPIKEQPEYKPYSSEEYQQVKEWLDRRINESRK